MFLNGALILYCFIFYLYLYLVPSNRLIASNKLVLITYYFKGVVKFHFHKM